MLSGEAASGNFPLEAVAWMQAMTAASRRGEIRCRLNGRNHASWALKNRIIDGLDRGWWSFKQGIAALRCFKPLSTCLAKGELFGVCFGWPLSKTKRLWCYKIIRPYLPKGSIQWASPSPNIHKSFHLPLIHGLWTPFATRYLYLPFTSVNSAIDWDASFSAEGPKCPRFCPPNLEQQPSHQHLFHPFSQNHQRSIVLFQSELQSLSIRTETRCRTKHPSFKVQPQMFNVICKPETLEFDPSGSGYPGHPPVWGHGWSQCRPWSWIGKTSLASCLSTCGIRWRGRWGDVFFSPSRKDDYIPKKGKIDGTDTKWQVSIMVNINQHVGTAPCFSLPLWNQHFRTWKLMVGRWKTILSFCKGLFSGAMLVLGGYIRRWQISCGSGNWNISRRRSSSSKVVWSKWDTYSWDK